MYVSDIKKVIQWYNLLQAHNMLDLEDDAPEKETSNEEA